MQDDLIGPWGVFSTVEKAWEAVASTNDLPDGYHIFPDGYHVFTYEVDHRITNKPRKFLNKV